MRRARRWLIGAVLLCMGCKSGRTAQRDAGIREAIQQSDAAYYGDGADHLDRSIQALDDAEAQSPHQPEVLWRRGRVHVALGMLAQDQELALAEFGLARASSLECLSAYPGFDERQRSAGWESALELLPSESGRCLLWAVHGWVRWMEAFGAEGALVDHEPIAQLHARSVEHVSGMDRSLLRWNEALLLATRPIGEGPAPERARPLFTSVAKARPFERPMVFLDLVRLVAIPLKDEALMDELLRDLHAGAGGSPMREAAKERARALIEAHRAAQAAP